VCVCVCVCVCLCAREYAQMYVYCKFVTDICLIILDFEKIIVMEYIV